MLRLESPQLGHQGVEVCVRDLWRVVGVVALIVVRHQAPKLRHALGDILGEIVKDHATTALPRTISGAAAS